MVQYSDSGVSPRTNAFAYGTERRMLHPKKSPTGNLAASMKAIENEFDKFPTEQQLKGRGHAKPRKRNGLAPTRMKEIKG